VKRIGRRDTAGDATQDVVPPDAAAEGPVDSGSDGAADGAGGVDAAGDAGRLPWPPSLPAGAASVRTVRGVHREIRAMPPTSIQYAEPRPLDHSPQRTAWWSILLRGLLAIVFGVIALSRPGAAAAAFVIVFAIYALADGAMAFVQAAWRGRAGLRWGWYLIEGLAGVAVGVIALAAPAVTLLVVVLLVAIRAFVLGLVEILGAFSFRGFESRWLLGLTGVVSVLFGILLLANPLAGGLALVWVVGIYAIVFGAMLFGHGLQVFGVQHRESPGLPRAGAAA
jgi:uncharacterized membrane protein HdeD (DUF308 family)